MGVKIASGPIWFQTLALISPMYGPATTHAIVGTMDCTGFTFGPTTIYHTWCGLKSDDLGQGWFLIWASSLITAVSDIILANSGVWYSKVWPYKLCCTKIWYNLVKHSSYQNVVIYVFLLLWFWVDCALVSVFNAKIRTNTYKGTPTKPRFIFSGRLDVVRLVFFRLNSTKRVTTKNW